MVIMPDIEISDELYSRYERLAAKFDDFENETALIQYLLESAADELERNVPAVQSDGITNEAVKDRLEDLGYIE